MQERLIREMVKLRGGPTKLKALCKEYDEVLEALEKKQAEITQMRNLILDLTSNGESSGEEES